MGSSCCKNSEKNNDKPLEIATKESGPIEPADTTEMKAGSSSDVKDSIHPSSEIQKSTESSGKSLKQNEMEKSVRDSKSSPKIPPKESGPIDSADLPKKTELKTASSSAVKIPAQSPSETPKLVESKRKSLKQVELAPYKTPDCDAYCADPLDTTKEDADRKASITADSLSRALSKFSSDLYLNIESDRNVVFSPLSIALAMALLEQGASGKTREEILKLISPPPTSTSHKPTTSRIPDIVDCGQLYGGLQEKILRFPKEYGQLYIGNSVFLDTDYFVAVRDTYLQSVKKCFKNEAIKAPFEKDSEEARQQVNRWISEKTEGKISQLFGPGSLENDTVVLLVNAIYLKMDWERQFDVARTKEGTFYRRLGLEQKAKFIRGDGGPYMGRKDFHAVELPYKGGTTSMYIILPRDRDGIKELEKKINAEFLIDLFTNTRSQSLLEVRLKIPKFTMRFKTSLLSPLAKLGFCTRHELDRMFDRSRFPDNHRIITVKDIIHEAFIKVDEEGTEAAAVTAVKCPPYQTIHPIPRIVHFVADHPFMFVIVHRPTWSVMFMGKVESVENE